MAAPAADTAYLDTFFDNRYSMYMAKPESTVWRSDIRRNTEKNVPEIYEEPTALSSRSTENDLISRPSPIITGMFASPKRKKGREKALAALYRKGFSSSEVRAAQAVLSERAVDELE